MTKMKRALGLAVLLLGTSILVGCSSPAEETKPPKPADASSGPKDGTPPGTNASTAGKATAN